MNGRPEALRTQVTEQHPEDQGALGIHVVRAERGEWHAAPLVDLEILAVLVEIVVILDVGAELGAPVLPREEFGEPFVEPHVRPVLERDVVAEPLMRQLVRNEDPLVPRTVEIRALVG